MRDTYLLVKSKFVRVRNSSEPESNVNVLDEFSSRGSEDQRMDSVRHLLLMALSHVSFRLSHMWRRAASAAEGSSASPLTFHARLTSPL